MKVTEWYGSESISCISGSVDLVRSGRAVNSLTKKCHGLTIVSKLVSCIVMPQFRMILRLLIVVNGLEGRKEITGQKHVCSIISWLKFRVYTKKSWINDKELTIEAVDLHWN